MPIKIDFHVHSFCSHDAFQSFETILTQLEAKGLDGVLIADHNDMSHGDALIQLVNSRYPDPAKRPIVIRGGEYSTERGHIIVIGLTKPLETYLPFVAKKFKYDDVMREARAQNAFIILAHPYRVTSRMPSDAIASEFDAIEVYNARTAFVRGNYKANAEAIALAKRIHKPIVAGSDGHLKHEIGGGYALIHCEREAFDLKRLASYRIEAYGYPSNPVNECVSQIYKAYCQKNIKNLIKNILKVPYALIQGLNPEGKRLMGKLSTYEPNQSAE